MRAGRNQSIATPGDWLVALRGLRDNPVRSYLLACRRRRKPHFWLRPDIVYFIAAASLVSFLVLTGMDLVSAATFSLNYVWSSLSSGYRCFGVWMVGIPLALWWMQGLYLWVLDCLSLLSYDRGQALALPMEMALVPVTDAAVVLGAQASLLPPVLLRTWVTIAACCFLFPWPYLGQYIMNGVSYVPYSFSIYFSWYVPLGLAILFVSAMLVANAMGCMFICAGDRKMLPATKIICAYAVPLLQLSSLLLVNMWYWNDRWDDLLRFPAILQRVAVAGIALIVLTVLILLLALGLARAKIILALVTAGMPLLALVCGAVAAGTEYAREGPAYWSGSIFCLVTPLAAPDPACLFEDPQWFKPPSEVSSFTDYTDEFRMNSSWYSSSHAAHRPLGYMWVALLRLAALLLLNIIGLEAAKVAVAQWRHDA